MHHRIFGTPDILLRIAQSSPCLDGDALSDRRALVSLACVSQAFSSPALDVLWAALPTFSPLARLFPVTTVRLVKNESDGLEKEEMWYDTVGDYKVRSQASIAKAF